TLGTLIDDHLVAGGVDEGDAGLALVDHVDRAGDDLPRLGVAGGEFRTLLPELVDLVGQRAGVRAGHVPHVNGLRRVATHTPRAQKPTTTRVPLHSLRVPIRMRAQAPYAPRAARRPPPPAEGRACPAPDLLGRTCPVSAADSLPSSRSCSVSRSCAACWSPRVTTC